MVKENIILDVDPGIDDSLAILLACAAENPDLQALTIVSGNIEVNQAAKNGIKALSMAKRDNVPVYKGTSLPLEKVYTDATDTHGLNGGNLAQRISFLKQDTSISYHWPMK